MSTQILPPTDPEILARIIRRVAGSPTLRYLIGAGSQTLEDLEKLAKDAGLPADLWSTYASRSHGSASMIRDLKSEVCSLIRHLEEEASDRTCINCLSLY